MGKVLRNGTNADRNSALDYQIRTFYDLNEGRWNALWEKSIDFLLAPRIDRVQNIYLPSYSMVYKYSGRTHLCG